MEKKKTFTSRLEAFFAGKGFYIVLFLCVATIGITAWTMLTGQENAAEPAIDSQTLSEQAEGIGEKSSETVAVPVPEDPIEEAAPVAALEKTEPIQEIAPVSPQPDSAAGAVPQPKEETVPVYFIRPVAGEIENPYSMEALQYNRTMRDWRTHDGIDIAAELGSQVKSVADGSVEKVYADDAMGTTVVLLHSGGLRSVYSNLAESPTVSEGEAVAGGSVIGSVGTTALSEVGEVTHLHFAMSLNGKSVDPTKYLP